jgi:hypothetical protein
VSLLGLNDGQDESALVLHIGIDEVVHGLVIGFRMFFISGDDQAGRPVPGVETPSSSYQIIRMLDFVAEDFISNQNLAAGFAKGVDVESPIAIR